MNGRVALVTGSGNGIGRRIAVRLAQAGARVVIADRDQDAARDAAAEVSSSGVESLAVVMDVSDEASVAEGFNEAVTRFGRLDALVSNAGVQHIAGIADLEFADWRRVVAVHLDGAVLTTRAAFRIMRDQATGGAIVYMGSVHSVEASPLKAPYV
ncbi:MAG: SDR family NAD(P)-dependent oxidoreductase, partial [Thermoleophilia bacterium]|nr:SDR family NAD(P)-dependent oxidoreductase [Thermoleophilia bacterium]